MDSSDKKANPFKVPENYFGNFKMELMDALPEKKTVKVIPLWKRVLPWTAVAAIFCGIVISIGIFQHPTGSKMTANMTDEVLYEEDYLEYMEEQSTEFVYRAIFYENDY